MKAAPQRLLVVDDDHRLRTLLSQYLTEQGYSVDSVGDATDMDKKLARNHYALMVLDLMLPGEDGLAICRRLRGNDQRIPIVMLTAKGDEIDRILGLEMGADDYLPKPFNPRELLARINAVLRRKTTAPAAAPDAEHGTVEFGEFRLDLATRQFSKQGTLIGLTSGEFALLKTLSAHARQPLSRDQLMQLVRGREHEAFDRSIDVQISRLRKLVEDNPAKPRIIQTIWGFGYVFVPDGTLPP